MVASTGLRDILRTYRKGKEWTQENLAENWNYSFETISAWERGRRRPTRQEMPRLAKLLAMDVQALTESVYPTASEPESLRTTPIQNYESHRDALDVLVGAHGLGVHVHPAPPHSIATVLKQKDVVLPHRSTLDRAIRLYIEGQIQQLWDTFHLTEELDAIISIQIAAVQHKQLLTTLSQWSLGQDDARWIIQAECEIVILLGRIARDQLNYDEAVMLHRHAFHLAQQSQSAILLVAAVMRLAETLVDAGLPYDALQYCEVGLEHARYANPRVRGELLGLTGLIYARMGNFRESERHVQEAAACAPDALTCATAGGIRFSETAAATYQMIEALAHGDHALALTYIERAHSQLALEFPAGHNVRWEAHLWIHRARAHRAVGDIECACDDLRRAAHLAHSISSQIGMRKVQDAMLDIFTGQSALSSTAQSLHHELRELSKPRVLE